MDIRDMFPEEFVQQSPLGEFFLPADQSRPSSSSSSLRSMSVGSPENSSLIVSGKASSSPGDLLTPTARARQPIVVAAAPAPLPPHQLVTTTMQAAAHGRSIRFPTLAVDEAAITNAMLSIISSSSSPSTHPQTSASTSTAPAPIRGNHRGGAFKPYNGRRRIPLTGPRAERQQGYRGGQVMFKRAVSMLRQISSMNAYARPIPEAVRPTSNQLLHMISERKRREKLNESFTALRMLLPPGTKKDKASVLVAAKDYLNSLKSQISELEEKNRMAAADEAGGEDLEAGQDGPRIEISRAAESSSEMERVKLMVTVRTECDTADLVLSILVCIKEMGNINLVSLEANGCSRQMNPVRRAAFVLQIKSQGPVEWDEAAFREAITRAIQGAAAAPSATSS